MSHEAGLNVGAKIDARLAMLFRQLCRKELLDEHETEELVGQAMSRPAAMRPHPSRTPALALDRAALPQDTGSPHHHQQGFGTPFEWASDTTASHSTEAREKFWRTIRIGWRAALRRT